MHQKLVKQEQPTLWKSISNNEFGEDSIEIAASNNESILEEEEEEDDDDDEEIYQQSDLQEKIKEAEKKFSTSSINTSYYASEYFEHPALYRVLFMGSISEDIKKDLVRKLSQGFVHVLQQQQDLKSKNLSLLGQPIIPFKEIKHNALLLSDEELTSDTCEDIGVSLIEADFTWNSNAVNYSSDPTNLLLQYAWKQCPNPRELPSAWLENEIFKNSKFTGYMYPEKTPNGIDLCVYFYEGPTDEARIKVDLELLCLLRKLGIYVLPLTTTRDESIKSHFADLLTEYKVRCLDLGNLEVGQEPSFFHKPVDRLARLKGIECTQLNIPRVATYQILAVDQFCGIENKAIFQLLKRTRERQVIRDEFRQQQEQEKKRKERDITDSIISSTSNTSTNDNNVSSDSSSNLEQQEQIASSDKQHHSSNSGSSSSRTITLLLIMTSMLLSYVGYDSYKYQQSMDSWTVTFNVDSSFMFTISTKDRFGESKWLNSNSSLPQIWLNHGYSIPIERVQEQPGHYKLLFDPFSTYSSPNQLIPLVFTVNSTSNHITFTVEPTQTESMTYLLLNNNQKSNSQMDNYNDTKHNIPPSAYNSNNIYKDKRRKSVGSVTFKKAKLTISFLLSENGVNIFKLLTKNDE